MGEDNWHNGWRLCLSSSHSVGLNTEDKNSWTADNFYHIDRKQITKYIKTSTIEHENYLAEFLHTFDENVLGNEIYEVCYAEKEEVKND